MSSSRIKGLLFASPWIAGLCIFTLCPLLASIYYSFTHFSVLQQPKFIGVANYTEMAQDEVFWHVFSEDPAVVRKLTRLHGPGKPGGHVFCYFEGDDAVVVWTHERLGQATHRDVLIIAREAGNDHAALTRWWRPWHHRIGKAE